MKRLSINTRARKDMRHARILNKFAKINLSRNRLVVTKTNANIYAQVLDTANNNHVLAAVSSLQLKKPGNIATAKEIGELIAAKCLENNIHELTFDRRGQKYHGQLKALADAVREKGVKM